MHDRIEKSITELVRQEALRAVPERETHVAAPDTRTHG